MAKRQTRLDPGKILVRALWARMVVDKLKQAGADLEAALAEAGLELRMLNKADAWIPFTDHARLLEIAARELSDDCFGLNFSATIDIRDAGLLAYLGIASRTVEEAMHNLARYLRVFSEAYQISLKVAGETGTLTIIPLHSSYGQSRQAVEFSYGVVIHAYRQLAGIRLAPLSVQFVHNRRSHLDQFAKQFGCPVKFNRNQGHIVFSRKTLAMPIRSSDDRLLAVLRDHADDLLRKRPPQREEFLDQIERRLAELLPRGQARIKTIATELGMSERTLVRRLAEINMPFTTIVERLRQDLASRYLAEEELSFTQIAFLLGYSNPSAFSVAYKRWTGRSPRKGRAERPAG
ncbi:AraC family transcriptional regulator [Taklimakanibacter deserti]|uniref:AraC family transcriptional regulator n=1 Tax=Taklimakanibacter deserti TaxID=2267839 RepID=UPI0013C51395